MKILQVVHAFPPWSNAGAEKYTYSLSQELTKRHEVHVFYPTLEGGYLEIRTAQSDNEPFTRHQMGVAKRAMPLLHAVSAYLRLEVTYHNQPMEDTFKRFVQDLQPDVIHFQHLIYLSAGFVAVARALAIPTVFTLHDYWFSCPLITLFQSSSVICAGAEGRKCQLCWSHARVDSNNRLAHSPFAAIAEKMFEAVNPAARFDERMKVMHDLLAQVDRVVAPSRFLREWYIGAGLSPERIIHVENGYNAQNLTSFEKAPYHQKLVFGFMGRMLPIKGVHLLLEAFLGITEGRAELRIYGGYNADDPYVATLKRSIGHRQDIKLMGPTRDVGAAYKDIDVLVFPSIWYENCPLTLAECRILGIPVLASNLGAIPDFVADGHNGYLFNPGDAADLREKISRLIAEPHLLKQFDFKKRPLPPSMSDHVRIVEGIYAELHSPENNAPF